MVSGLRNLVTKEIKEMLRDPKILLGMVLMPLIIFPVMGAALNISQTAVEESMKDVSIAMMDLDKGSMAENLILTFESMNITVSETTATTVDEALEDIAQTNITTLVVAPPGFTHNLTSGLRGELEVYSILRSVSISEGARASAAETPIAAYESLLIREAIKQALPDRQPETVLNPIAPQSFVVFKGTVIKAPPEALRGIFMSQSFGFPMVIMLLLISATQIAATSIAIEKEEKTLETLLTLPVSRLSILVGKLAGSVVVAIAGAAAALVGVNFYTGSILSMVPTEELDLGALGLTLSPTAYILLGVAMFVTIISALALAICIAVFADNVRSAQSLVSYIIIIVVLPALVLMFADINILPPAFQAVMYAIPYTHSILASKAAFMGDYVTMLSSIAYISAFTAVILYIAAKIFTTDRIFTARVSLRRLRLRR